VHPYSAEGVNFIVCDAAARAESAARKSRAAQLVSFVRAGQKFRRHEHEFSIKAPMRALYPNTRDARSTCRFMAGRRRAKLKTAASLSVLKREPICFPPPCARVRERAANVYFNRKRERWDMNFSLSAGAHAAFRMPNNIYTCCAPHLRLAFGAPFPRG
jgi:hypothetical protein